MTQIKVELVKSCCTDLDTVNAARVSFDKESSWEQLPNFDVQAGLPHPRILSEADTKLIKYLASHRHMTPFRHNFIKLRVKAPIFLARLKEKYECTS